MFTFHVAMKSALCFAVCLLLIVDLQLDAEAKISIAQTFTKDLEIYRGPRQTSQECTELFDWIDGNTTDIPWPSAIDQSCVDATLGADSESEAIDIQCSSVCQSEYDLFVECEGQEFTDLFYEILCGPGGFNSAGTTTISISLLAIWAFLAVLASVF